MRRKPQSFLLLCIALSVSLFFSCVIDSSTPTFASAMPKSNPLDPTITFTWGPSYDPRPGYAEAFGDNMNPGNGITFTIPPCSNGLPGLENGLCTPDRKFLNLENTLIPCSLDNSTTCIEQVEIRQSSGAWTLASFESEAFEHEISWPAFPTFDIGPSFNSSIYTYTELDTGTNRKLFVRGSYEVTYSTISKGPAQYEIEISSVVNSTRSECTTGYMNDPSKGFALKNIRGSSSICYQRVPFNNRIRLTLNMKTPPSGWIDTYLGNADAILVKDAGGLTSSKLTIEGDPVVLPTAKLSLPHSDIESRNLLCGSTLPKGLNWCSETNKLWSSIGFSTTSTNGLDPFGSFTEAVKLFPKQLDIAETEYSTWRVRIKRADYRTVGNCSLPTGLYGLIGGNALLLSSSIPIWNPTSQSLEFGVASPHYRPDGQTAIGFYEMQINEKVAQCLWGTTITPQNVSLSVFDDNGQTKAAAATISSANGMIAFRASGFTYSSSTLRATLKTTKNASTAKRLTCVKGRSSKLQPRGTTKCPKGWKKK